MKKLLTTLSLTTLVLFGCNESDRTDVGNVRVNQDIQLKNHEGQLVSIPRGNYDGWAISEYENEGQTAVVLTDGSSNFPFVTTGKTIMLPGKYGNGYQFKLSAGSRTGQPLTLEMREDDQRTSSDLETTESCDISDSATVCRREIKPGSISGSGSCQSWESDCKCENITVTRRGSRRVRITYGSGATTFTFLLKNSKGKTVASMSRSYDAKDDSTALESCR